MMYIVFSLQPKSFYVLEVLPKRKRVILGAGIPHSGLKDSFSQFPGRLALSALSGNYPPLKRAAGLGHE